MSLILDGTNGLSDVDGSAGTPAIRGSDTNTGIFFDADIIGFSEGGTECARFNADAQFVAAAGTALLPVITTTGDVNTGIFFPAADTIAFAEGGAEAMRIDSSGNLLVGLTSTAVGGDTKMIQAAGWIAPRSTAVPAGGVGGSTLFAKERVYFGDNTGWTWDWYTVNTSGTTFRRFYFTDGGAAYNATGTWGSISDAKLKENIVDSTPKLDKLNQVRIVNFNLIGSEQKQLGVIAQELEQIFPGMVEETVDKDAEGNDLGTTTKAVKYSVFVPMLIKAIQEQQAIITALTARVEALEGAQV
jgi:hypothetical protein